MLAVLSDLASALADQPFLVVGVIQTALLLAATSLLVYPVVAYARNVAYTEGLVGLAAGLTLMTVGNLVGFLPEATVRAVVPLVSVHPLVWSALLNLLAGVCGTVGVYFFAREFLWADSRDDLSTRRREPVEERSIPEGGFEAAGDGGREGEHGD